MARERSFARAIPATLAIGIAAFALAAPATAAAQPAIAAPALDARHAFKLQNGLEVAILEEHAQAQVHVTLALHRGYGDDPADRRGAARLLAALFADGGTRHLRRADRAHLFESLEIKQPTLRPLVRVEDTRFSLEGLPSGQLALHLWMLGDRLGFWLDGMDEEALTAARAAVAAEDRNLKARTQSALPQLTAVALYGPTHPNALPFTVEPAALERLDLESLRARAREIYTPRNALLVIAGDVDPDEAKKLVTRYFGPIVAGPETPARPSPPKLPELSGERRLSVEAPTWEEHLWMSWPTAPMTTDDDYALDVLGAHLDRVLARRLKDAGLVTWVNSGQESHTLESRFWVNATIASSHTSDEVIAVIDAELDALRAADLPADQMARAVSDRLTEVGTSYDDPRQRAFRLAGYWGISRELLGFPAYVARYRAITPAAFRKAVTGNIPAGKRVVAVVKHKSGAPAGGRLSGGRP
jgi:zinc protease